jgi:hypothetical protein
MSRLLAGILGDVGFDVTEARLWLGDITDAEVVRTIPSADAGLTEDQQLALCERILTKPPISAHHVVWIAFNHAGPGSSNVTVGPVSFWGCEWVRLVLADGTGPNIESIPPELRATDGLFDYEMLPQERDVMLARVDLGVGAFTDPIRIASEQAEAIVALASFPTGMSQWRRLEGYLDVRDGRIGSTGTFALPLDLRDMPTNIYHDRMETKLRDLTPRLTGHLPIVDTNLTEVIGAVHWWQQACRQEAMPAVLLHVASLNLLRRALRRGHGRNISRAVYGTCGFGR